MKREAPKHTYRTPQFHFAIPCTSYRIQQLHRDTIHTLIVLPSLIQKFLDGFDYPFFLKSMQTVSIEEAEFHFVQ